MSWILPLYDSRAIRWTITLFWTVFLTILLVQPETQPIIPTGIQPAPPSLIREVLFSIVHLIMFGITSFLWCIALESYFDLRLTLLSVALFIISYGFVTELAQGMSPGRTSQIWDIIANVIGNMIGITLYWRWQKR